MILTLLIFAISFAQTDEMMYSLYQKKMEQGDVEQAMKCSKLYLASAGENVANDTLAWMCEELALWYEKERYVFSESAEYYEKAINIYNQIGNFKKEADLRLCLARLYLEMEKFHMAFKHTYEAQSLYSELHDEKGLVGCYNVIAMLHYVCGDYDIADKYFEKYAQGGAAINDSSMILSALNNKAIYSSYYNDSQVAEPLITEAINMAEELGDTSMLVKLVFNLCSYYLRLGNQEKAEYYNEYAAGMLGSVPDSGVYYINKGMIFYFQQDYASALENAKTAVDYFKQGEFYGRLRRCYSVMHRCNAAMGRYEQAYTDVLNFIESENRNSGSNDLSELFRARYELARQIENREAERRDARRMVILTIVFACLAIAGVIVFFKMKRKTLLVVQREKDVASEKEIIELKKLSHYKHDKIVEEIVGKIGEISENKSVSEVKSKLNSLVNELQQSEDSYLQEINNFIPEFNSDFFKKLLKDYPGLTTNERRLCAMLTKNLSSKEISDITRQSAHSINVARTRLRKKLGIDGQDVSIQEFLSKYN